MTLKLTYNLEEKCSNNQTEQSAIVKALDTLQDLGHVEERQRYEAIHTDSKITFDATANPRNHQNLIELIRERIRKLEEDN